MAISKRGDSSSSKHAGEPFLILLIEDEPDHAELIRKALQFQGFPNPVEWIDRGDLAIAYLARSTPYQDRARVPGLILLDLKLPRKSGFDILEWMAGKQEFKSIPVVILTSSKEYCDLDRALHLGATTYIVKPPVGSELKAVVETVQMARSG